ncbi:MAG: FRG domain-containing protein [Anaerolineae bacterium]|nr:FRG domain-containing protein [Anaerolineae bacterium]
MLGTASPTSNNSHEWLASIHFDTAEKFLEYISPTQLQWLSPSGINGSWIFRGQYNSDWNLTPSAMRSEKLTDFKKLERPVLEKSVFDLYSNRQTNLNFQYICDWLVQTAAEELALEEFVRMADHVGHLIPTGHQFLLADSGYSPEIWTDKVRQYFVSLDQGYANLDMFRLTPTTIERALAQHHGIPTRLLDWTYSSFAAAYFAAEEAVLALAGHQHNVPLRIAVFALRRSAIDDWHKEGDPRSESLKYIEHRRGSLEYLRAQHGLFVFDAGADKHFLNQGQWRTFEEVLFYKFGNAASETIQKITLPVDQSFQLLRLLAAFGVTRAHLMPSLDTVKDTLEIDRILKNQFDGSYHP